MQQQKYATASDSVSAKARTVVLVSNHSSARSSGRGAALVGVMVAPHLLAAARAIERNPVRSKDTSSRDMPSDLGKD